MQIKSTTGYKWQLLFCGVLLIAIDVAIIIKDGANWFLFYMVMFFLVFCVLSVRIWIAYGRTFIFDESGCTVAFLKYKKHYSWNELEVIQYKKDDVGFHYTRTEIRPEIRLVFWEKGKKVYRGKIGIESYCIFFHPLSCVFVGFLEPEQEKMSGEKIYIASKEEFMSKMDEWGISLHSLN